MKLKLKAASCDVYVKFLITWCSFIYSCSLRAMVLRVVVSGGLVAGVLRIVVVKVGLQGFEVVVRWRSLVAASRAAIVFW